MPPKKFHKPSTVFPRASGRLSDDLRRETIKVRVVPASEGAPIRRAAKAANCTPAWFLCDAGLARANGAGSLDSDVLGQTVLILNAMFIQAQDEGLRICPKLGTRLTTKLRRVIRHLEQPGV